MVDSLNSLELMLQAFRRDDFNGAHEHYRDFLNKCQQLKISIGGDNCCQLIAYELLTYTSFSAQDYSKILALSEDLNFVNICGSNLPRKEVMDFNFINGGFSVAYSCVGSDSIVAPLSEIAINEDDSLEVKNLAVTKMVKILDAVPEKKIQTKYQPSFEQRVNLYMLCLQSEEEVLKHKLDIAEYKNVVSTIIRFYDENKVDFDKDLFFSDMDAVVAIKQRQLQLQKQNLDTELEALAVYYNNKFTIIINEITVLDNNGKTRRLDEDEKTAIKQSVELGNNNNSLLHEELFKHDLLGDKFKRYHANLSAVRQCQEKLKGKSVIDDGVSQDVDKFIATVKNTKQSKAAISQLDKIIQIIILGVKGYYTPPWRKVPSADKLSTLGLFKKQAGGVNSDGSDAALGSSGADIKRGAR